MKLRVNTQCHFRRTAVNLLLPLENRILQHRKIRTTLLWPCKSGKSSRKLRIPYRRPANLNWSVLHNTAESVILLSAKKWEVPSDLRPLALASRTTPSLSEMSLFSFFFFFFTVRVIAHVFPTNSRWDPPSRGFIRVWILISLRSGCSGPRCMSARMHTLIHVAQVKPPLKPLLEISLLLGAHFALPRLRNPIWKWNVTFSFYLDGDYRLSPHGSVPVHLICTLKK